MKKLFSHVKILSVLLLGISEFYEAQQTSLAAGDNAQSATGSVSYSVGQTFYEPQQSASGRVTAGVPQPYKIFLLSTQENEIKNGIAVYPNPVKDFLVVDLSGEKFKDSTYQLFDGTGRIISKEELKKMKT